MENINNLKLKRFFVVFQCEMETYGSVRTYDTLEEVQCDVEGWLDMCYGHPMSGAVTIYDSRSLSFVHI